MDAFTGTYYVQNGEKQEATILFLKDRLSIGLRDEQGRPRLVYWPYEKILQGPLRKRGQCVVRFDSYPVQTLEIDSAEFADKLEAIFLHHKKTGLGRVFSKNRIRMIKIIGAIMGVLLSIYFWLVPFLAEQLAMRVPIAYETELGNELFNTLKTGYVIDEEKTAYINDFFYQLNIATDYPVRITVVKEDIVNAFALPGGNIIVYDRLLAGIHQYEELAALLSHEFSHIQNRHTTRTLFRQLASTIFLSVILGDVGTLSNGLLRHASRLKGLSYSRKLEKEADLNGVRLLSERKIDCKGFVQLFQMLQRETNAVEGLSAEWISSHPQLETRIHYIQNNEWFNKKGTKPDEALRTLFLKIKTGN